MRIVSANVGPGRPLAADAPIQVAFDRYLLPSTVTRQAITVVTAEGEPLTSARLPVVTYDPIARTVTLVPPAGPWLEPGSFYRLVLAIPQGSEDSAGIRAIDRATLDPGQDRSLPFLVTSAAGRAYDEGRVHFCTDVLPIFVQKCGGAQCHGHSLDAAASLVLTTTEGVQKTAIGRVAQAANTSGRSGVPESEGSTFGTNMAIVAPGSPGSSYLLYAVDLPPLPSSPSPGRVACAGPPPESRPPAAPYATLTEALREPGSDERARLADHLGGRAMPYPAASPAFSALDYDERQVLRRWIAQMSPGDALPTCGPCP